MNGRKFGRDLDTVLGILTIREERILYRRMHRVLRSVERKAIRRAKREQAKAIAQGAPA